MKFTVTLLSLLILPLVSASPFLSLLKRVTDLTSYTQNDLVNGTPCLALTIIYARGSTSPGNVGDQPGPQLFQAVADKIGLINLAVQGVNYSALDATYPLGGDKPGSNLMASLVAQAVSQCPNTKISVGGYSQGAQLVHNAAKQFSDETAARVTSVFTFGDPFNGTAVENIPASKVLIDCHTGDWICGTNYSVSPEHLNYANDVGEVSQFIVSKAGL